MKRKHYRPSLRKKFIAHFHDHDVYSINAFAIRNLAEPDEGNKILLIRII